MSLYDIIPGDTKLALYKNELGSETIVDFLDQKYPPLCIKLEDNLLAFSSLERKRSDDTNSKKRKRDSEEHSDKRSKLNDLSVQKKSQGDSLFETGDESEWVAESYLSDEEEKKSRGNRFIAKQTDALEQLYNMYNKMPPPEERINLEKQL